MSDVNSLEVLDFPLNGVRLIEASAGTGKTYTIAALYVRLILGHGSNGSAFQRPLLPPDILVVTFTDASTKELRDRIRARLSDAARYFRKLPVVTDPFLENLRAEYKEAEWSDHAHRLEIAANWMDEAAVFTIHGWCNRMLKQHAFDSGSLFQQTLNNDDAELLLQVVRDYWRTHFYALSPTGCHGVFGVVKTPDALAKKIKNLLKETEALPLDQALDWSEDLKQWEAWENQRRALEETARKAWFDAQKEIKALFDKASDEDWLKQNIYSKDKLPSLLDKMNQWAKNQCHLKSIEIIKFSKTSINKGIKKDFKKESVHFELKPFNILDDYSEHLNLENDFTKRIIPHAIQWIRHQYSKEKQRLAQITYDDMLTHLDQALQGERGQQLANVIRSQYPVAMIDEFQDTDPVQYRIFSTLYPAEQTEGLGCFMIGDPKQAIYSFRGADIFTYLQAHQATTDRHYTLDTNYRSTQGLVKAINRVFLQADQRLDGLGAFQFKNGDSNPLPFVDVQAQGRKKSWLVKGEQPLPLTAWVLESDTAISFTEYQKQLAEATASEIVGLLNSAQTEQTGFAGEDQFDALQPGDIAILVRTGTEAKIMRQALSKRGLPSVYLSERDSIYASPEAGDMLIWLKALADPRNETKVRAALSTATFAYPYVQLQHFITDEVSWEQHLERFMVYQQRWQLNGILPALRQLISDYDLHNQVNDQNERERSLTNLLHLAELLQQASTQLDGEQALIRHLAEAIADESEQASEDLILRLESDANLIKIITIHKSKGLEYPLVFLPFIATFKEPRGDYFRFHDENKNLCIDFDKQAASQEAANQERLQEDLRLLYVALTRAQYACWLGLAPVKFGSTNDCLLHKSAIGYLLDWRAKDPSTALRAKLESMKGTCAQIAIASLPEANAEPYTRITETPSLDQVAVAETKVADTWWIASYSALTMGAQKTPVSPLSYLEPESAQDAEYPEDEALETNHATDKPEGVHQLPKGAGPGVLVHALLETLAKAGFSQTAHDAAKKKETIQKLFSRPVWQAHLEVINSALDNWLSMPLFAQDDAFCLASLETGQYQAELEFLIGVDENRGVDVQRLDTLVSQATFSGLARPAALPNQLTGLLKGFIDLVFVHNGRYYVADYKFNHLGNQLSDYAPDKLREAMLSKRYDLQMVLYLLALHRLLKARLGQHYDYDQHIGGGLYLFLRGAEHASRGLVLERPDRVLIETLDQLFTGEGQ